MELVYPYTLRVIGGGIDIDQCYPCFGAAGYVYVMYMYTCALWGYHYRYFVIGRGLLWLLEP